MSSTSESELNQLREQLRHIEEEFERQMRARGFDPSQDENLALTEPLAKLYAERERLRSKLQAGDIPLEGIN